MSTLRHARLVIVSDHDWWSHSRRDDVVEMIT